MGTTLQLSSDRKTRLVRELQVALAATSTEDLGLWGGRTVGTLRDVTMRRGRTLGSMLTGVWSFLSKEVGGVREAVRRSEALPHLKDRAAAAQDQARTVGRQLENLYDTLSKGLERRPRDTAQKLIAGVLGFLVGAGGVDGDGGVPDLDLLGGIGDHRSILTHSIVSGIVVETIVLGFLDLSRTVYGNLPEEHDPLWDQFNVASGDMVAALATGLSAGIAYHLGIDATLDGEGTYKDLPISLPVEGHQAIVATNAAIEGVDAAKRATEPTVTDVESRIFTTFRAAADFAKRDSGWTIVRSSDAQGFRVVRKRAGRVRG